MVGLVEAVAVAASSSEYIVSNDGMQGSGRSQVGVLSLQLEIAEMLFRRNQCTCRESIGGCSSSREEHYLYATLFGAVANCATHHFSATETNRLILFAERVAVYCENRVLK
jgi:hypothetical protein